MKPNSTWYANLQQITILMMSVISDHDAICNTLPDGAVMIKATILQQIDFNLNSIYIRDSLFLSA